ncbi:protein phosphatase 2C domain-containing protein [Streptomyces kronopolitis]|uniref:protein phosphatase 2C domain-containing protein n=1 Tax=Streptomyces kronopolitis TaxID=1612435 RepID=UPI00341A8F25
MKQQGTGRGHEDDWWRRLYGDGGGSGGGGAAGDTGASDAPDTLDDRVASALRAVAAPGRTDRTPRQRPGRVEPPAQSPRRRDTVPPQEPSPWAEQAGQEPPGRSESPTGDTPGRSEPAIGDTPGRAAPAPQDTPERPDPAAGKPPVRSASPPPPAFPTPPAPIPLQATGPGSRPAAPRRPVPPPRGAPADPPRSSPPLYDPEPGPLPAADPAALDELVPDTALDGSRYGSLTLRAASRRGDLARHRGDARRDALLTVRFGSGRHALLLVAVATGPPSGEGAARAARDACAWIGGAVGRSCTRLAEDIRTDQREALRSGLRRLTDRGYGALRARAQERGLPPECYTAALRCLLLPADPECRTRVFFGVGPGGLLRLRDGAWQDLEPTAPDHLSRHAPADPGDPTPPTPGGSADGTPAEPFLFRTAFARPGDMLLLCSAGLAEPLQQDRVFAARLAAEWSAPGPPGLTDFLTAAQLRVEGHPKDRTAVAVWES